MSPMFFPKSLVNVSLWPLLMRAILVLLALGVGSAMAADPVRWEGMRVSGTKDRVRVVLDLSAKPDFTIFPLIEPRRLVIDLHNVVLGEKVPAQNTSNTLVSGFVAGKISKANARIVLTLASPALAQNAFLLPAVDGQHARLVFELERVSEAAFAQQYEEDRAGQPAIEVAGNGPVEPAPGEVAPVEIPIIEETKPEVAAVARPIILIDPGHGGIDGGAVTPAGLREKDIVFEFASLLEDKMIATGRFDVALTRDEDVFVGLKKRVDLARANKVDLYISLHADSFTQASVGGMSIYTLSEDATDILDKVLAERENKADLVAGFDLPQNEAVVVDILVDLMRRETRQTSYGIARSIVAQFQGKLRLRKIPLRRADFFVLQAPEVPSILVELGFLSNAEDVRNLTSKEWRNTAADAIVAGVMNFMHVED